MYYLTYKVTAHPSGITKEQVPDGEGACHSIIVHSMLYQPDGSFSLLTVGTDGRNDRDVEPNEMFKVWTLMASELADYDQLSPNKREFCKVVFESIADAIKKERARG